MNEPAAGSAGSAKTLRRSITAALLLGLFTASLTWIVDNDTYMHLSLGRLLVEHGGFPQQEVFSYPSEDKPFAYSSWLFGTGIYGLYLAGGGAALSLLKALLVTALVSILLFDALTPAQRRPWLALLGVIAGYALIQDRMALRPELVGVLCMSASIWLLNRYWYLADTRGLYLLPAIAWIWANSHSSVTLGFLLFGTFILAALLAPVLRARAPWIGAGTNARPLALAITAVASLAASLLTPYGMDQYLFALQFHDVLWYQQSIVELRGVAGGKLYAHVGLIAAVAASFVVAGRRLSLAHLLLVLPLLAMPFQSTRYTLFAVAAAIPFIVRNLGPTLEAIRNRPSRKILAGLPLAAFVTLLAYLAQHTGVPGGRAPIGLGLSDSHRLAGVVGFFEANDVRGRVMNDFNSGTYLVWKLFPDVTVFIESRGYVSPQQLEDTQKYLFFADTTERLFDEYGFQTLIAENYWGAFSSNREAARLRESLSGIDRKYWSLVYWDDSALVYLRRKGEYAALASSLEYRHARPDLSLAALIRSMSAAANRAEFERELRRVLGTTRSVYARALLALLFLETGDTAKAVTVLSEIEAVAMSALSKNRQRFVAEILGDAQAGAGDRRLAEQSYLRAIALSDDAMARLKLGRLYRESNRIDEAIAQLEVAADLDPRHVATLLELGEAYGDRGDTRLAAELARRARDLRELGTLQALFREAVQAQVKGDYARAESLYVRILQVGGPDSTTLSNLAFIELDTGRPDAAQARFREALRLDPGQANAYYGLALVAREREERSAQVEYLRRYLELAPTGYFGRQAVAELERLGSP